MKTQRPFQPLFSRFLSTFIVVASLFFVTHSAIFAAQNKHKSSNPVIVKLKARIIAKKKHPFRAFTQGLSYINNKIYESSGLYGQSFIMEYFWENPQKTAKKKTLPPFIFAEGLVAFAPKTSLDKKIEQKIQIFLLTWKENRFFSFPGDFIGDFDDRDRKNRDGDDKNHGDSAQNFFYDREGWGITFDGKKFITSEGTHILTFRDKKLRPLKNQQNESFLSLKVHKNQQKVDKLNELEYAPLTLKNHRKIFLIANVWGSDFLAAIDKKGNVIAEIDCRHLSRENRPKDGIQRHWGVVGEKSEQKSPRKKRARQYEKVLNGVALLRVGKEKKLENARFLVTGKKWKWIYLVQFSPVL